MSMLRSALVLLSLGEMLEEKKMLIVEMLKCGNGAVGFVVAGGNDQVVAFKASYSRNKVVRKWDE